MKYISLLFVLILFNTPLGASTSQQLEKDIAALQEETQALQRQLGKLKQQLHTRTASPVQEKTRSEPDKVSVHPFHDTAVSIHAPPVTSADPAKSQAMYPTALIADNHVVAYIAGTPVVTSPYTGDRPAFDGSDYIVNISSINRDIRLMQQRRRFYEVYEGIGYPAPQVPIIAISGKAEPVAAFNRSYDNNPDNDFTLGSSELDMAAILNKWVEAFMSVAYDESPPAVGPRVTNSALNLNLGFVNIGNLDRTPFYFTAGQLYAPFGRYSSSFISAPLPLILARVKTRPFILGYKSQTNSGPYAAVYGFISETNFGGANVGGANLGYIINNGNISGDLGVGVIGSLTDSQGMQLNGSPPLTTFGGFASPTNGNEAVKQIPGIDVHGNISIDRYTFTAEWVGASRAYPFQDLSFNNRGAKPQAAQLEAGLTFIAFDRPASFAVGYQWSKETLALNIPKKRAAAVFSISIWKDTVESLEYRHDMDFNRTEYANGASAPGFTNLNTVGSGHSADAVLAQIGVYF